jgi:uncharacterized membrane protein
MNLYTLEPLKEFESAAGSTLLNASTQTGFTLRLQVPSGRPETGSKEGNMFGFLFGTACLIGLVVVARRGRHPFGFRRYHRHYRSRGLHHVLAHLDTAPGQEKVIFAAARELEDRARESSRAFFDTRRELADVIRGDHLDEARLEETFRKHDATLGELRAAFSDALRKIHETLDERQRKALSDLVESAPRFHWLSHRYGHC